MKKVFVSLAILLLLSCSNNEENNIIINQSDVLLKKVITHNYNSTYETVFTYDGKKLLEQKSYRQRKVFTYNGDKIIKIEWYQNPNSVNNLLQYVDFEYFPNGTLKQFKKYLDAPVTVNFSYNTDGTVDFTFVADYNTIYNYTGKFTIENDEIKKCQYYAIVNEHNSRLLHNDNKNHPLKNVIGYDKLLLYGFFYKSMHESGFSTNFGNIHNQISFEYLTIPNVLQTINIIEYDNNNFPKNIDKDNTDVADYLFYE